jgi:energy-coupling factor transporter ATP-binding protein EcfA2
VTDVSAVIEGLELAVGLAAGQIPPDDHETAVRAMRAVRDREGHLGSTLLLVLVGGTGVGKSSLLNAIAGEEVASTGVLRPHTRQPLAWVPVDAEPSLLALLDELHIDRRVEQRALPGFAVVDLVDIDSVAAEHLRVVVRVMPAVDVAVWVVDPVKYADLGAYRNLIAPGGADDDRLVFALNRIDTVPDGSRAEVAGDLTDMLRRIGVRSPVVFETAAAPPDGPATGVDALVDHLMRRLDEKRSRIGRILVDARRVAAAIAAAARIEGGSGTGFEERWDRWRRRARTEARNGLDVAVGERLLADLERFVADVAVAAGPALGAAVRERFPATTLEEVHRAGVAAAGGDRGGGDRLVAVVEESLTAPLRELLWPRAVLAAVLAGLAVDAEQAARRLRPQRR